MTKRQKGTEYRAGKGSDVTIRLVNPDTRRWEIEKPIKWGAGFEAALRESFERSGLPMPGSERRVTEVPDWQLEDMVTVTLAPRLAQARSLMARIRRDWPALPDGTQ